MSDDTQTKYYLTKRDVMKLFGGLGVGAIIAEGSRGDLDGDGGGASTFLGAAEMSSHQKVGEGMWKGPLSARSSVPQEDGNDFLQTDAGPNGNLYALHHYDSGWSVQGLDVPELEVDEATIGEGTPPSLDGDLKLPNEFKAVSTDAGGDDFRAFAINGAANRVDIGGVADTNRVSAMLYAAGTAYWEVLADGEFRGNGPNPITGIDFISLDPQDVRNISSPSEGDYADHDGSGTNTEGLARFDGSDWISQVDGSTIS